MKKNLLLTAVLALFTGGAFMSQTEDKVEQSSQKSKYINQQGYLSKSSLKDYKSFYGDSLNGFDEAKAEAKYLEKGLHGVEFMFAMNSERRFFIDQKYKLGVFSQQFTPVENQVSTFKPIGGGNSVNVFPCVNEDFESTVPGVYSTSNAVAGWTVLSGMNSTNFGGIGCNGNPNIAWNPGSPEFSIVATPVLGVPFIGNLPNSPFGGNNVARLQNTSPTGLMTRIQTQFPVTNANTLFQFAFAGSWDGAHACCDQGALRIDVYNCTGSLIPLPCANLSLTPGSGQCIGTAGYSLTGFVSWTNWQVKSIDLTPYIGQCIRLVVTVADCVFTGHHGSLWFDSQCGGQLIGPGLGGIGGYVPGSVSFCAGANQAVIAAPAGYVSYQWIAPGNFTIAAPLGTASSYTVNNPIPGSTYTLIATSQSGCQYVIPNTINFTQVGIAGFGSGPSCTGGASGTATVQGGGSGGGYNYVWLNSNSVSIGSNSTIAGLAPGNYSVVVTGLGSAGCGSATTTFSIGTAQPTLISVFKPYCNNEAYLCANSGSNFKWYNNLTPIAPPAGVQQCFTVTAPVNGGIYHLSYLSSFGCQDSIRFTLGLSAPGAVSIVNNPLICPGASNGSAVVSLTPALGAPPGQNTYSVFSTGTTTPVYSASLGVGPSNTFPVSGLTARTYSVIAFDGSCRYGTTFNVVAHTFTWALSPSASSLCPGNSVAAGITFSALPSGSQYTYSWSPTVWLPGNNGSFQSTIITPTVAAGTVSTVIYTVVVTPSAAPCPQTKTLSITAINPAPPVITPIPNMCNNSTQYTVMVTPVGGTFAAANPSVINSITGVLSPTFVPSFGTNTMSYAYSIWNCVATSTAPYQVSQFNTSALTASVNNLCVTNPAVNLMNIVQSAANGTWTGVGVSNNFFVPAALNTGLYPIQYVTTSNPNPTVCPSITNLNVAVTKTTTPYITPVSPFCNNKVPFTLTVTPAGGGWVGNGVSNAGVVTPTTYANYGIFNATYTVADGPCVNSNVTTLNVSQFVSSTLTAALPPLCASNPPFNLMSIVQNTTGSWSQGNGVNGNFLNPAGLTTGAYSYTYTTISIPANPGLCDDQSVISTQISNPPAPVITQVGPYCNNGGAVQLTVTPNIGAWTTSPFLNSNGVFTPSLCPVGNNIVQYVIGTNTCNSAKNMGISIEAFVSAALVGSVPDQCNTNSPYNLQFVSQNNLGSWSGPGVTSSNFNPAAVGSGVFVLTYNTLSSPSGICPDQSTVAVSVYSLAPPDVSLIGPFCSVSMPVQIQVSPTGGIFGGANNFAVSPGGLFAPGEAIIGDNIINYSVTSGPCVAYAQTTVIVEAYVSADFAMYVNPFCRNANAVNLNSYVNNPGGVWSGPGMSGSMFNPAQANIGTNNLITYSTVSTPLGLCKDTSMIRIRVNELPNVTITSNDYDGCAPVEVILNLTSANTGTGEWNFGDGSSPKSGLSTSYVYNQPGTYTVMFSYADEIGCEGYGKLPYAINVFEVPKADFSAPSEVLISNPEVQLINLTSNIGSNKYNWSIGTLYEVQDVVNPVVKFEKVGRYPITLRASNANNCKNEITKTVEVKNDFNIYIPSSFTPNFDGLNDVFIPVFSPYGLDSKTYELEIFDRWGHSLFYTKDPSKGWDGSVQNKGSEELKEEVYIYRIKYKDTDGNVYNKMGHLSLLK
jgi:gliding motility-associated-like protein